MNVSHPVGPEDAEVCPSEVPPLGEANGDPWHFPPPEAVHLTHHSLRGLIPPTYHTPEKVECVVRIQSHVVNIS